jgi:hypothetical protein
VTRDEVGEVHIEVPILDYHTFHQHQVYQEQAENVKVKL